MSVELHSSNCPLGITMKPKAGTVLFVIDIIQESVVTNTSDLWKIR